MSSSVVVRLPKLGLYSSTANNEPNSSPLPQSASTYPDQKTVRPGPIKQAKNVTGDCEKLQYRASIHAQKLPRSRSTTWPSRPRYQLWIDSTNLRYGHIHNRLGTGRNISSRYQSKGEIATDLRVGTTKTWKTSTSYRPLRSERKPASDLPLARRISGQRRPGFIASPSHPDGDRILPEAEVKMLELAKKRTSAQRDNKPPLMSTFDPQTFDLQTAPRLPSSLGTNSFNTLLHQIEHLQVLQGSTPTASCEDERALLKLKTLTRQPSSFHDKCTHIKTSGFRCTSRSDVDPLTPTPNLSTTYRLTNFAHR